MTSKSAFEMLDQEKINKLRIIIKSDVAGTSEAINNSLKKIGNDEVDVDTRFLNIDLNTFTQQVILIRIVFS